MRFEGGRSRCGLPRRSLSARAILRITCCLVRKTLQWNPAVANLCFLAGLCLTVSSLLLAASQPEDLKTRLRDSSGRERVDILNELSKASWGVSSDETIEWADKALVEAQRLKYPAGEACALRYKGIGFWYRDDYNTALDLVLDALRIYESIGDEQGVAGCLSTIGTIYLNLERFDRAIESYTRALPIAEKIGDRNRVGILHSNLGTIYIGQEHYEDALEEFSKALPILEETGSALDVLTTLANIGGAYKRLGRYDEALAANREILERAEQVDSRIRMTDALMDMAEILTKQRRYDEAEPNVVRALDIARKEALKRKEEDAERIYSELCEARGDYPCALQHLKRSKELRGQIFTEENARAIADLRLKYETEKNENELRARELEIERDKRTRTLLIAVTLIVLVLAIANYGRYRAKRRENILLDRLARTDVLTGVANRRSILESLDREHRRMQRDGRPFSVVLLDIDHFKSVNDRLGHEAGDEVLVQVAKALRNSVRDIDEVARWGGEEFLALLPACSLVEGVEVAERIREHVQQLEIGTSESPIHVTISAGVSTIGEGESIDDCLRRADRSLYEGKQQGRNRVVPA